MAMVLQASAKPSPGSLPLATLARGAGEAFSGRTRRAELLILCARIGFNP